MVTFPGKAEHDAPKSQGDNVSRFAAIVVDFTVIFDILYSSVLKSSIKRRKSDNHSDLGYV